MPTRYFMGQHQDIPNLPYGKAHWVEIGFTHPNCAVTLKEFLQKGMSNPAASRRSDTGKSYRQEGPWM